MKTRVPQKLFHCFVALLLLVAGLASQSASAVTLPFYDGFDSSLGAGNLGTNAIDGTNWGFGTVTAGMQVGAYGQSYPGLQSPLAGSQGVHLTNITASQSIGGPVANISSGSVYASFLLKVNVKPSSAPTASSSSCTPRQLETHPHPGSVWA